MKARYVFGAALAVGVLAAAACSGPSPNGTSALDASAPSPVAQLASPQQRPSAPQVPNFYAGPPDLSTSVTQRGPRVAFAHAFASRALRDLPDAASVRVEDDEADHFEHEPGRSGQPFAQAADALDPVLQRAQPAFAMPVAVQNFLGQGQTMGGCIFPKPDSGEPAKCTTEGDPPDTVGAAGPNDYVQVVNSGVAVWSKTGALLAGPKYTSTLFTGMPTTDGNNCGAPPPSGDDGDGVVLYDQLADRWIITQFDLTNYIKSGTGPSYQCVAVSQTGDPTGAYWLYDFKYAAAINDYGKFSVWQDAYYASFNDFNPGFTGADLCAWDRAAMLTGATATETCFTSSTFAFLPASVDGPIKPPSGEPGFFVSLLSGSSIGLYRFHADFTTPANATFTGPTTIPVGAYNQLCNGGNCVTQPSPGNPLASLGDRPMFHLSYRNFGTVESLVFNHSVRAGSSGGIRWYEIRSPNATPVVFQQGTYAPDANYRWMGSIAQDQAQDLALGYSVSGAAMAPTIAWTGHLATDAVGVMGQSEAVVQAGVGTEDGTFSNGQTAERWGDYSNMTVDPTDDCTFWYTQELYPANGTFNWDTRVSSVTFPECAQNDFSITLAPASQNVMLGQSVNYTVTTALTKGVAETVALVVQDLPTGVTSAFVPATVTAGGASVLTLSTTAATPLTASPDTFTVIGKATSAVHAATAQVSVVPCVKLTTCPSPDNCGTMSDGCGGTITCGSAAGACVALDACHVAGTCTANVCSNPAAPNGATCNDGNACTTTDVCAGGVCGGTAVVCMNGDACHNPGTCQAATGACSGPVAKANGTACTGGTCEQGTCTPNVIDSGTPPGDAGPKDSGASTDSGTSTGVDSGSGGDSGSGSHADGGTPPVADASSDGAEADAAGGGGNAGSNGGCGCRTVQPRDDGTSKLAGLGALAMLVMMRRRSKRL